MKLYKDINNNIFAYELDGSQDHLIADKVEITKEEVSNIHNQKAQDELDKLTYGEKRARAYPPLAEQLDYIYHIGVEAWKADMILPVKNKYPKGSE